MSSSIQIPKRVLRFYGNSEFALDTIAKKEAVLIHSSKLNDPFDPYFFFENDFHGNYATLKAYISTNHADDMFWFEKHYPEEQWAQSIADINTQFLSLRNATFIFSTSAAQNGIHPKHNLHMWGHYGNGHRGVAIEFDTAAVAKPLIDQHNREKSAAVGTHEAWIQIRYAHDLSPLSCKAFYEFFKAEKEGWTTITALERHYNKISRIKSNVWKQENEWRLLWRNDETKLKTHRFALTEKAIRAIYLGLASTNTTETELIFELRRNFPKAKLYKATKHVGAFALEFHEISS